MTVYWILHYSSDSECEVRVDNFSVVSCFYRSNALHCNRISVCLLLLTFHFSKGTQHKCTDRCFQIDQPQSDQWKHSNYLWYYSGRPELKAYRQYQSLYGWYDEWLNHVIQSRSIHAGNNHICTASGAKGFDSIHGIEYIDSYVINDLCSHSMGSYGQIQVVRPDSFQSLIPLPSWFRAIQTFQLSHCPYHQMVLTLLYEEFSARIRYLAWG